MEVNPNKAAVRIKCDNLRKDAGAENLRNMVRERNVILRYKILKDKRLNDAVYE